MTWYEKYRPKTPDDLIGAAQQSAARALLNSDSLVQRALFIGPSGTGKTTVARIYASHINDGYFELINCREIGVGDIRQKLIEARISRPLYTKYTVFILDEMDALSNAAQQQLLDIEDIPEWLVFLATTKDPHKLRNDLRSRFLTFTFNTPDRGEIGAWLLKIFTKENFKPNREDVTAIINTANGNLRNILNGVEALSRGIKQADLDAPESEAFRELFAMVAYKHFNLNDALKYINQLESISGFVIALCKSVIKDPVNRSRPILLIFGEGLNPNLPEDVSLANLLVKFEKEIK